MRNNDYYKLKLKGKEYSVGIINGQLRLLVARKWITLQEFHYQYPELANKKEIMSAISPRFTSVVYPTVEIFETIVDGIETALHYIKYHL